MSISEKDTNPERRRSRREHAADELSDEALALEFARRYAEKLCYVAVTGQWLEWDGSLWQLDRTMHVVDLIRSLCRERAQQARDLNKPSLSMEVASSRKVHAVERLVRADRRLAAAVDQWDTHRHLLNTPSETIDLRTGARGPNCPTDFITKRTAVNAKGECPMWLAFLARVLPDAEVRAYVQRAAGYSLTGYTDEHAMFFLYGTGANGKSVFLSTLLSVMGDYAVTSPIETFTDSTHDRHPTELARLRGARLVVATETEEGKRWAESKIKALTAGDKIAAHYMRQDFFEFSPEFKLWVSGNHKPALRGVDEGIRRRMNLIPFAITIPEAERDQKLVEKLKAEWPGILQWLVDGCRAWFEQKLSTPASVRTATSEYLSEEDSVGAWITECCTISETRFTLLRELYDSWRRWADKAGEFAGSQKRFARSLQERGFPKRRQGGTGRVGFELIGVAVVTASSNPGDTTE